MITWLILFLPFSLAQTTDTSYQTVSNLPQYAAQKPCVQNCFYPSTFVCANRVYQNSDGIASAIGCQHGLCQNGQDYYPAEDDCFCRLDLQTVAQNYLSTCILAKCTVGDSSIDMSSAVSLYNNYCWGKGFVPATTTAPGTQGQTTATGGITAPSGTITAATTSGIANGNGGGGSSSNGLSPGIDAVIGIASLFIAILTLWVAWITYKKMR